MTTDGNLSWRIIMSCSLDSDEALENQKHILHEVSTKICAHITKVIRWIGSQVQELPRFNGLRDVQGFIEEFEEQVPVELRSKSLDIALKDTPARWWDIHRETMKPWEKVKTMLKVIFGKKQDMLRIGI